jgi:hypothetical protein
LNDVSNFQKRLFGTGLALGSVAVIESAKDRLMIGTTSERLSADAGLDGFGGVFTEDRSELRWLTLFLTASEPVAAACLIDGCSSPEWRKRNFRYSRAEWERQCTLRAAIQIQRPRIAQLSSTYEGRACSHRTHAPLSEDLKDFAMDEGCRLLTDLDVLCRCALVLCGIEKRPPSKAALLLGVSNKVMRAAYCTALEHLDVMRCERFREEHEYAAVCN